MLALSIDTAVMGYWSDGTANVELDVTIRNEGNLRFDDEQQVILTCVRGQDTPPECHEEAKLSLDDGFGPASTQFVLRLPMGNTVLEFDYGGDDILQLGVEVPGRILGVERDVWECYSHRPAENIVNAFQDDNDGCGGWGTETVEKWLNDVPVKVWAAGDDRYVEIFEAVIEELAPLLNLDFQWVEAERDADLKAFAGIPQSERAKYGFDFGFDYYVDYGGFAGANTRNGEALSGHLVVWRLAPDEWEVKDRNDVRHIIMHEVLHAMAPIGHSARIGSIMSYSSNIKKLSPMDESLIRLNSHPLIWPGMTMAEVEDLLVLREDLLDVPPPPKLDTHQMVWRATVALWEAGSARFKVRGGWPERRCGQTFGVRRGLATLDIGNFGWLPYYGASWARFSDNVNAYWMNWSKDDGKWLYWREESDGLNAIASADMLDASAWWTSPSRLPRLLGSLLNDAEADDIKVVDAVDGTITLRVQLDESFPTFWLDSGETADFALILDDETHEIEGYIFNWRRGLDTELCDAYEEVAEEVELGVPISVPGEIKLNTFK